MGKLFGKAKKALQLDEEYDEREYDWDSDEDSGYEGYASDEDMAIEEDDFLYAEEEGSEDEVDSDTEYYEPEESGYYESEPDMTEEAEYLEPEGVEEAGYFEPEGVEEAGYFEPEGVEEAEYLEPEGVEEAEYFESEGVEEAEYFESEGVEEAEHLEPEGVEEAGYYEAEYGMEENAGYSDWEEIEGTCCGVGEDTEQSVYSEVGEEIETDAYYGTEVVEETDDLYYAGESSAEREPEDRSGVAYADTSVRRERQKESQKKQERRPDRESGFLARLKKSFHNMDVMDKVMLVTGTGVVILMIVTAGVFISSRMVEKQVSDFASVGTQLEGISTIGEQGLLAVADAEKARLAAASIVNDEIEEPEKKEYDETGFEKEVTVALNRSAHSAHASQAPRARTPPRDTSGTSLHPAPRA